MKFDFFFILCLLLNSRMTTRGPVRSVFSFVEQCKTAAAAAAVVKHNGTRRRLRKCCADAKRKFFFSFLLFQS